ncbi:hypothetical protein H4R21_003412 [Coemansia helicoidea]|nr:hypothetical protein H4R21_003412 [Coemansia helicoidea]
MLTTSGRAPHGAVRETQLGHAAWLGGVLVEGGEGGPDAEAPPVTQAWLLALRTPAGAAAPCVVLQHAGAATAAVEDADGSWRVHEALRRAVADRHLVFVGACGRGDNGASRVLCVFEDSAQIADIGVDAQQALAQTRQLAAAPADCSITHGACATTRAGCAWAVVAVQPTRGANPQAAASEGRPRATLRAIRVAGSGGGDDAASVDLEHSVSCLRAFAVGEHVLVVAGTYEPGVCVYRIDGDSTPAALAPCGLDLPLPELLLPYGRGDDMDVDDAPACPDAAAVSDVYVLTAPSRSFVLAGLRNGLLAWTAMPAGAPAAAGDLPSASAPTVVEAGTAPIVFSGVQPPVRDHALPDPPADDASRALICAGSLYVARIGDQSQLEMAPCAGEDRMPQPICKVLPLAAAATASDSAGAWRFLMVSGQGCAAVAAVATRAQGSFRELRVEGMPRRIVRDRDTGLLLVASAVPPATACLSALDPVSGQVRARVQFLPSERVCALATWYVQGPKLYRYVCVGTAQQAEQQATGGRLVIFSLKPARRRGRARPTLPEAPDAAGGCELKYVWESARGGPVAAVASMGDAYLVVAAGASCAVLRLDVARKQVVECCSCALRFPVTSLDVDGHDIAAGSEREAVSLLRFTPGDGGDCLELRHSARFGVCAADARFLAPGLVAGVDRSGYVFVMGIPDGPSEFALDFALGFHLGVESTRLRVGCAVRRLGPVPHVLPWSDPPAAAPSTRPPPCLVVTAVDGAVWAVARITDDAFALLRLLEQAMLHMPLGHPARPLLAANGTANRARGPARIPPANVIDGTLAAVFAGALTETEQGQVVDSSPDLTRLAREMAARRGELGSGSATAAAARFIGGVVRTLARTGSC